MMAMMNVFKNETSLTNNDWQARAKRKQGKKKQQQRQEHMNLSTIAPSSTC